MSSCVPPSEPIIKVSSDIAPPSVTTVTPEDVFIILKIKAADSLTEANTDSKIELKYKHDENEWRYLTVNISVVGAADGLGGTGQTT